MIRLDMSEFQTPEQRASACCGAREPQDASLIASVRKQPFSVVLLDEFEKAHPNVWDLFLQVFDDGRLTDRAAEAVDFRHGVIILTSNLGAAIPPRRASASARSATAFDTTRSSAPCRSRSGPSS